MPPLDLTDSSTLDRLIKIFHGGPAETPQHDVLRAPELAHATVEDTYHGVLLPVVKLGVKTNLKNGVPGFNAGSTEYHVHFTLSDSDSLMLRNMCYANLRREFEKKPDSLRPFVERAFDMAATDDVESAWGVFKSMARVGWESDGSFLVKHRSSAKRPSRVCVRSAEGVDHTGRLEVFSGCVVRLDVRVISWGFKEMFGVSIKMGIGGITLYHTGAFPIVRTRFLPGNFYMCKKNDGELLLRDACGHPVYIRVPNHRNSGRLHVDADFMKQVKALEDKVGCPLSSIQHDGDDRFIEVTSKDQSLSSRPTSLVITPAIRMVKSMRVLHWLESKCG